MIEQPFENWLPIPEYEDLYEIDTKNLELIQEINKIQKINKIYDVIENKNITGIEARLLIQDILDKEE